MNYTVKLSCIECHKEFEYVISESVLNSGFAPVYTDFIHTKNHSLHALVPLKPTAGYFRLGKAFIGDAWQL